MTATSLASVPVCCRMSCTNSVLSRSWAVASLAMVCSSIALETPASRSVSVQPTSLQYSSVRIEMLMEGLLRLLWKGVNKKIAGGVLPHQTVRLWHYFFFTPNTRSLVPHDTCHSSQCTYPHRVSPLYTPYNRSGGLCLLWSRHGARSRRRCGRAWDGAGRRYGAGR